MPAGTRRDRLLIGLGQLEERAVRTLAYPPALRLDAVAAYREVLANKAASAETRAWAYAHLGASYEAAGRTDEALELTREGLVAAQQAGVGEQIYRLEWQLGRILATIGDATGAEAAYARAVDELDRVRSNFPPGAPNTFAELVAPVYTGYADLRLARAARMSAGTDQAGELRAVRDLLETLKHAEVEDYFASECLVTNTTRGSGDSRAAVVYPVFLDRRTEIIVEAGDAIAQFTVAKGRLEMQATIRAFRRNLERVTAASAYRAQARTLYELLIAPIEPFLAEHAVTTLVIVPEGALRTVPFGALHDGERFLVERFAIATTPAMSLVNAGPAPEASNLLAGGVSESVQGFSSLPNVTRELDEVGTAFGASTIRDASFSLDTLRTELGDQQYSMAHFATHGKFEADYRDSFLLTYDSRLTLLEMRDALVARGGAPLDLLVLSACETAAGDDRAALGLAGVAVQSGARSAIASLWRISDAATAELVPDFYRELRAAPGNKAQRLRSAQLNLIQSERFSHPSYWAPFLLIGDWR
jgi:CHAT domain-containing protein